MTRILVLIAALLTIGCSRSPLPGVTHGVERVGMAMGSSLHLTAWTADDANARAAFDDVFRDFDRLENEMSVWRPGSDVLRINAAAGDHAVAVVPEVRDILHIAKQVSEWTDGTFDVTFG